MNYVEPSVVRITEKDPYKKIESAGRTCYKSESKITKTSVKKFVQNLIKRQHYAMLEHVYFVFELGYSQFIEEYIKALKNSGYYHITRKVEYRSESGCVGAYVRYLVSANVRAICEQKIVNDPIYRALKESYPELVFNDSTENSFTGLNAKIVNLSDYNDLTDEEIKAHSYFTFRFITDRGVTHELVRHRPCSFAQESTRYVNYKDGLNIVLPTGFNERIDEVKEIYNKAFEYAEKCYGELIELGQTPQQARAVLPTALKTEIVVTASFDEWVHIINLRYKGTTGAPHPDIKTIITEVYNNLKKDKMVGGFIE